MKNKIHELDGLLEKTDEDFQALGQCEMNIVWAIKNIQNYEDNNDEEPTLNTRSH